MGQVAQNSCTPERSGDGMRGALGHSGNSTCGEIDLPVQRQAVRGRDLRVDSTARISQPDAPARAVPGWSEGTPRAQGGARARRRFHASHRERCLQPGPLRLPRCLGNPRRSPSMQVQERENDHCTAQRSERGTSTNHETTALAVWRHSGQGAQMGGADVPFICSRPPTVRGAGPLPVSSPR